MQMLSFRFVSYKDVLSDGGRCFKGVHLSQVHQPNKRALNIAQLVQFLLGWCTSCSGKQQSRAETSAPPEESVEE